VAVAACVPSQQAWDAWKAKYEKVYENRVEEQVRRGIWNKNFERVAQHNLEESVGMHTYTQEMNFFADIDHDEYVSTYLMEPLDTTKTGLYAPEEHEMLPGTPATQDWTTQGRVTPVKNQEQCGSCWAFSATGGLEGAWSISHSLISLSEQQLVSCDNTCSGCNGGWYTTAWQYLISYGGSISEANYPYTSGNGNSGTCQENGKPIAATVKSYTSTQKGSESSLENAVGNIGPVSVAIDASQPSFNSYSSGIYSSSGCSSTSLDHAVLVVGYNQNSQGQYWIVKNSWGTNWGQAGYVWMAKNDNDMCGILNGPPAYPTAG
jgi:C1A family cysteine protease